MIQISPDFMLDPLAILKFVIGFGVGAMIGLERQKSRYFEAQRMGMRTFGLTSMLGTLSGFLYSVSSLDFALYFGGAVAVLLFAFQFLSRMYAGEKTGYTTSMVSAIAFLLGMLVGLDNGTNHFMVLAIALSFFVTFILSIKEELTYMASVITRTELTSAIQLGILAFMLWPLIPESVILFGLTLNLKLTYYLVLLLLTISFVNYILVKKYQTRGLMVFALFGGIANSEATVSSIVEMYNKTGREYPRWVSLSVILANMSMMLRNLVIIIMLDPTPTHSMFRAFLVPIVIVFLIGLYRGFMERKKVKASIVVDSSKLGSPFSLGPAIRFAALFMFVTIFSFVMQNTFADFGVIFAAVVGGLASAGAVVFTMCVLLGSGTISLNIAVAGAVLSTLMAVSNKIFYVVVNKGDKPLLSSVVRDILIMLIGGGIYVVMLVLGLIAI